MSVESIAIKVRINDGDPLINNVIALDGELDFDFIEHDIGVCICSRPDVKVSINLERDKKQTMILNYIVDNISTNIQCLKYLPFSQVNAIYRTIKDDDIRLKILDSYATMENIDLIESTLLQSINWDAVST